MPTMSQCLACLNDDSSGERIIKTQARRACLYAALMVFLVGLTHCYIKRNLCSDPCEQSGDVALKILKSEIQVEQFLNNDYSKLSMEHAGSKCNI